MYWNTAYAINQVPLFSININMRCIEIDILPSMFQWEKGLTLTWDVLKFICSKTIFINNPD